jgi:hypothetical protein
VLISFLLLILLPIGVQRAAIFGVATAEAIGRPPIAPARACCRAPPSTLKRIFASTARERSDGAASLPSIPGSWSRSRTPRTYTRYDYTAWGEPIRSNGFAPDDLWFGARPETIVAVDGEEACRLIPTICHLIETYRFRAYGDYSPWPGPNSNTFVQAILDAVPELKAVLPPTAIGIFPMPANGSA